MTRAICYDEFGGPEVLKIGEVEPMPMGPDSVAVKVAGVGINPVDYKVMRGFLAGAFQTQFPVVAGWDVAGEVLGVGPSVTELVPGDRIYAYARMDLIQHGTAAELVNLPIRTVAKAPESIDLVTAAAVPLTGLTAFQLINRLNVQAGETVLVHNASGGVGQFAAQFAQLAGARVIGTSSPGNHTHLRSLGVEPVDYRDGLADAVKALVPEGVNVVVDLIGHGALNASDDLLHPGGRVGSITDAQGAHDRGGVYVFVRPSREDLAEIAGLIDANATKVDIAGTYGFEQAAQAYRELEQGHVRGKIVLVP